MAATRVLAVLVTCLAGGRHIRYIMIQQILCLSGLAVDITVDSYYEEVKEGDDVQFCLSLSEPANVTVTYNTVAYTAEEDGM